MNDHVWFDEVQHQAARDPLAGPMLLSAGFIVKGGNHAAAELLRLAQREADLLEQIALSDRAALERSRRIVALEDELAASESRGRAYCLELAEKAGRIRELEADADLGRKLVERLSFHCGESGASEGVEETLVRIIRERDERGGPLPNPDVWVRKSRFNALEAAIEDGIAGIERARQGVLDHLIGVQATVAHNRVGNMLLGQLDLAHEALSAAVRVGHGGAAPGVDGATAVPIAVRLDGLETAWGGVVEQLAALKESSGHHAVMLTDHADRLAAMEATSVQHAERAMRGWADTDKRARLLEAAIDESARRWEDLAEIVERDGSYTNAGFLAASARRLRQALEAGKE